MFTFYWKPIGEYASAKRKVNILRLILGAFVFFIVFASIISKK
jgi:hypothetical protein